MLDQETNFVYKVSAEYCPQLDRGFVWNDPAIDIEWPIVKPILSDKDATLPVLQNADNDFAFVEIGKTG